MKCLLASLIRPHLEFSNVAWLPRLIKDRKLIEQMQRCATKLVPDLRAVPYEQRLEDMKIASLSYKRAWGNMIEVYNNMHGYYTINQDLLP